MDRTVRRVVIDHMTVGVTDLERSAAFYRAALAPLGFADQVWNEPEQEVEFGPPGLSDFAISTRYPASPAHVAFLARDRAEVDAFHAAALAAGGVDHGAPGVRPEYSDGYYGAFVLDPDGHNVEAVHHDDK
jgi:catechol 2,3-dioxygenase-like lactoylglutathione lyase family enzyme